MQVFGSLPDILLMGKFADTVLNFTSEALPNAERVLKTAAMNLAEDMNRPVKQGGRLRVRTGFLRNSFGATINAPNTAITYKPTDSEGPFLFDVGPVNLVINAMNLGDTLYFTWTANYAIHREMGARGQAGDAFVRTYANPVSWQGYIDRANAQVNGSQA